MRAVESKADRRAGATGRESPSGEVRFFGHTNPNSADTATWEPLEDHLRNVASRAEAFGSTFGAGDWARLAGLWHDLGKYRRSFQEYLLHVGGAFDDDGCEEGIPGRVDHSTVGAVHSRETMGGMGSVLAYLIAGHHAGLPDASGGEASLTSRVQRGEVLADWMRAGIPPSILEAPLPASAPPSRDPTHVHLWVRMLFSCLTDADFLATEEFMNPAQANERGARYSDLNGLAAQFEAHMTRHFGAASGEVNAVRREVLEACNRGADLNPGLFSLSVPTGGGKTLASMSFALRHAMRWGKRRIIYVIPYTSIVEQTADTLRGIFGDAVVEHHSNIDSSDPARDSVRRRLSAENWDAPIVVTTNVQFFESLFAARPSRCRKLHNIVNSVVILDEAQLLPPDFLDPIRQVMGLLTRHYGVSLVVSTATQPALELDGIRELAPDPASLAIRLNRVRYEWPATADRCDWPSLAATLRSERQVLCIVGRRDDARDLYEALDDASDDTVHLSALMCGEHRAEAIAHIRNRLADGAPIRVVSTQLVEAGVDFDFPVVFRAFAGLDSIAQAAGRCNREGGLPGLGRVVVFNPPRPAPRGHLLKAENAARELVHGGEPEMTPSLFGRYFRQFYSRLNSHDAKGIVRLLTPAGTGRGALDIQFREAAGLFRLVDDSAYVPVAVPWSERGEAVVSALMRGFTRIGMRRLQRFIVNIPRRQAQELARDGSIQEVVDGLFVVTNPRLYSPKVGLRTSGPEYQPGDFIA